MPIFCPTLFIPYEQGEEIEICSIGMGSDLKLMLELLQGELLECDRRVHQGTSDS